MTAKAAPITSPSLVTQIVIAEKYGIRLDTAQLAEVTRLSRGTGSRLR